MIVVNQHNSWNDLDLCGGADKGDKVDKETLPTNCALILGKIDSNVVPILSSLNITLMVLIASCYILS